MSTPDPGPFATVKADRLREAREYIGFSQDVTASVMRREPGWVDDIEHGRATVTGEELRKLSRLYRRPVPWLCGETTFRPDPEMLRRLNENPRLTDGDREAVLDFAEFLQGAGPMSERLRKDVTAELAKDADNG